MWRQPSWKCCPFYVGRTDIQLILVMIKGHSFPHVYTGLQPNRLLPGPVPYRTGKSPGRFSNRTGNYRTIRISRPLELLTLTGVLPKCRCHPNWASDNISESSMVKFTYICPNRAPTWPNKALPNRPLNPTDSPKHASPAYIRTFTGTWLYVKWYNNNPSTYYTIIYMDIGRLYSSNKSTLFTRSCYTYTYTYAYTYTYTTETDSLSCHFSDKGGNHL